jgi:hypothetical protein
VILFELGENLMPLQRQNTKRYLHPHLYDWPALGSTATCAGLPLMDWNAGRSNEVATQIVQSFQKLRQETNRIDVKLGQNIQNIKPVRSGDETRRVQILGAEGEINEVVDVAIIAIGFGIEDRRTLGIEVPAYWEDDGLEQALGAGPDFPQRILISGAGDGALIDLMGVSKNSLFQAACKSDSRAPVFERRRLAWGSLASSI